MCPGCLQYLFPRSNTLLSVTTWYTNLPTAVLQREESFRQRLTQESGSLFCSSHIVKSAALLAAKELACRVAVYISLSDAIFSSVLNFLSSAGKMDDILMELLVITKEASHWAIAVVAAVIFNLQLKRRDVLYHLRNMDSMRAEHPVLVRIWWGQPLLKLWKQHALHRGFSVNIWCPKKSAPWITSSQQSERTVLTME